MRAESTALLYAKKDIEIGGLAMVVEEVLFNINPNYQITIPSELTIQQLCHNFTSNNYHQTPPKRNHTE